MPQRSRRRLVLFTRYPEPGTTKTRMIPELGAAGAAQAPGGQMTEHIVSRITEFCGLHPTAVEIRFEGGDRRLMQAWLGTGFKYCRQGKGDIGRRMERALNEGFEDGCKTVVIIGSDIPGITSDIMQRAFERLSLNDLVLGPAGDGGYYLIGMHTAACAKAYPRLFDGVHWGTSAVLSETIAVAERLGLTYSFLDTLDDVDRPEDLAVWNQASASKSDSHRKKRISIIIPTLNEAGAYQRNAVPPAKKQSGGNYRRGRRQPGRHRRTGSSTGRQGSESSPFPRQNK